MKKWQIRSFSDVMTRLRENWPGYVPEFRTLLLIALLASLADMVSTIHILRLAGPQAEIHPVVRSMAQEWGPVLGPILGKAWQFLGLVMLTLFLRRWARYIFVPVAIGYMGAAWYNIYASGALAPVLHQWIPV